MKKIVIFGGGSGLSQILKGLKLFPLDITAIVTVADNGRSTGILREEFDIPAVGDITKVLLSMANTNEINEKLLNYRFDETSSIGAHSIKNLMLAALLDITGDFNQSVDIFCDIFNIQGTVLPITEECVDLIATTVDNNIIFGEAQITESMKTIKEIKYNKDFEVNKNVLKAIEKADLIIFAPGSLYTSILPHLIVPDIIKAIDKTKSECVYLCNLVTQPGETLDFTASEHIKVLNNHLDKKKINSIIVNNKKISDKLIKKYENKEQKHQVEFDKQALEKLDLNIIEDKIYTIEDAYIRHDSLKTAYLIFSHLMRGDKK